MTFNKIASIIGIFFAAVALWFVMQKPAQNTATGPQEAINAPAVEGIRTEEITPKKVLAYPDKVKPKSNLPQSMKDDPTIAILDSSTIPPSDETQTVTTALNMDTGTVSTIFSVDPKPWLAGESANEARLSYGVKNGLKKVLRGSVTADIFQVKSLHIGATGTLDSDGAYFAGAGVAVKW